ncbi:polysaccharide deacetylase family protein [Streptococcus sp. sy004]|uniref:polysaccharide deacetylase family protein n=1 Tax=Streptococcus sp. sy004 TaxID=2600149 RepID=UPI0011B7D36A|nr:polysaccharide deacetylase family protein [Streptococcus sp. sy004]TWT12438.1 polysaccharide deacetylase family protein [Streptococcus sp. sy004]
MPYRNRRTKRILTIVNIVLLLAIFLILSLIAWYWFDKSSHTTLQSITPTIQEEKVKESENSDTVTWVTKDDPVQIPILMYHAIHVMAPEEENNANLILDPTIFEEQIKAMIEAGYYFLSPEEAYQALTKNQVPQEKVVWLTFDDSLIDFYTIAFPILEKYGVKATNNVITSYTEEQRAANLSVEQMQEMKAKGISFQSHSASHPDLEYADSSIQTQELTNSKDFLDQALNQNTMTLAYPAGRYSDDLLTLVNQSYQLGLTTNEGIASLANGLLTLNRIRILPTTSAEILLTQLQP